MLDLYLFRHAESQSNINQHLIGGRSNHTPLSPLGGLQALWLGERLRNEEVIFDQVYSSTAIRTRQTANIVCEKIGYPLEHILYSEKLLELDQGDWQGQHRDIIYTPETVAKINKDNWNFTPPNGESQRDVEERMYSWVEENLLANHRDIIYTPETVAKINKDNWNFTPPNGESQRDVEERMYSWVEENLLANH